MSRIFAQWLNPFDVSPVIARRAACLLLILLALTASVCCMSYQLGNSADKPNSYKYHIGEEINYTVQIGNPSDSDENFTVDIYDILPDGTRIILGRNVSLSPGEEVLYNASYTVREEDVRNYPRFGSAVNNSVSMEITTEAGTRVNTSSNEYALVEPSAANSSAANLSASISEDGSGEVVETDASRVDENQSSSAQAHEDVESNGAERGDAR